MTTRSTSTDSELIRFQILMTERTISRNKELRKELGLSHERFMKFANLLVEENKNRLL
ncbi:hypothetical protein [Aliikangiella coralliicola]|uniref:hypothetical protein n=1 Tax=Aliikangiella coralliicola TaxID=2592383 RepID=UPI00143D47DC|nr:hypothetical protein [Aliikangiella coralliicola]